MPFLTTCSTADCISLSLEFLPALFFAPRIGRSLTCWSVYEAWDLTFATARRPGATDRLPPNRVTRSSLVGEAGPSARRGEGAHELVRAGTVKR